MRVHPRARQDRIGEPEEGRLRIRVAAAPIDDAANRAVTVLIAKAFRAPKSAVTVAAGRTSRDKTVAVRDWKVLPGWMPDAPKGGG